MAKINLEVEAKALAITAEALELEEEQLSAFVTKACGSDSQLLARVTALLAADRAAGVLAADQISIRRIPEVVGPYTIDTVVGRGGMGVVYKAHRTDGEFQRTVAIKFVNSDLLFNASKERFSREKEVTAKLIHPNIAQLLDAGEASGLPYFVMEFVEGVSLGDHSDRSINALTNLFVQVCDAISYAHNNLILHRDIKPSNVLVTQERAVKVLDFGVAKMLDPTAENAGATQFDALPLTRAYASPETVTGEPASVLTDVYSLGVTFYEAAHGKVPYDLEGLSLIEVHEKLQTNTPTFDSGSKDLDLIIAKAMHPDPKRRYASVEGLRDDLRRVLGSEPIAARKDDWRYVAGRFVSRNKAATVMTTIAVFSIAVGLIATSTLFLRAESQAQIARTERDNAQEVVAFLSNLLASTNPLEQGQQDLPLGEVLRNAREQINAGALTNDLARGAVESSLSVVHDGRGEYELAIEYARSAIKLLSAQNAPAKELAIAHVHLGQSLSNQDKYEEARTAVEHAVELLLPLDDSIVALVGALAVLGSIYESLTLNEQAEATYTRALTLTDEYSIEDARLIAQPTNNLGRLLHNRGEFDLAERYYREAIELLVGSPAEQAMAYGNLAGVYDDRKNYGAAEKGYREAISILDDTLGAAHPQTIIVRASLINSLVRGERIAAAREVADHVVALVHESLPTENFVSAYVMNTAGNAYCHGRFEPQGLDYAREAYEVRRKILPEGHWTIASAQSLLGLCEYRAGNAQAAEAHLQRAYDKLLEVRGEMDRNTQLAYDRLGEVREYLGESLN